MKIKQIEEPQTEPFYYWSIPPEKVFQKLKSSIKGISSHEASLRLKKYGPNLFKIKRNTSGFALLAAQFKNPLILLFLFTAILSAVLKEHTNSIIILIIVIISCLLGFFQERKAVHIIEKLTSIVKVRSEIIRDNTKMAIDNEELVLGDILTLSAGATIPADCLLLESKDLFVDESTLTGEPLGVEKKEGILPQDTPVNKRSNSLFMGSHVVSGFAKAIVVGTCKDTVFGKVLEKLKKHIPLTDFEKSIKEFSLFLMKVTFLLVISIFIFNIFLHRPIITSILFSLALSIGLSPQLLPAIISVNLAHGAKHMKQKKVIIKRLAAIENFGSMNLLCADKTGTLTEGKIKLKSTSSFNVNEDKISLYSYLNSKYQSGYRNPIDNSVLESFSFDLSKYEKIDELPYDFSRKRLTIVLKSGPTSLVISKGDVAQILKICTSIEIKEKKEGLEEHKDEILKKFEEFSSQGFKILGVAYRSFNVDPILSKNLEQEMTFLGFLIFHDPLKKDVLSTIKQLNKHGIKLKIITGDNHYSALYLGQKCNLGSSILTGSEISKMDNAALENKLEEINIFCEVDPTQKERLISTFKNQKFVVGYLGDGINDASALHSADIGISVNTSTDAAKEAADIVLLDKNLSVLLDGVKEGRKTFANSLKYIFMATSANFGNMFSMAGISIFLKFLPLLPEQILLLNLLTDIPEMTIASDFVDHEIVDKPIKMNLNFIAKFMLVFGLISSIFDFATFGALIYFFHASSLQFRTAWFIESVISASMIVLVIRTRKLFFRSRPSFPLLIATLSVFLVTIFIPYLPFADAFEFVKLPLLFYLILGLILITYIVFAEVAKALFYRNSMRQSKSGAS